MNTQQILAGLYSERDRLNQAIAALEALNAGTPTNVRRGRLPATTADAATAQIRGRRAMSAAARKRISETMRKRWAQRRKKATTAQKTMSAKKAAPKQTAATQAHAKGRISAAGRRRLSEMMKKRWAERRKATPPGN